MKSSVFVAMALAVAGVGGLSGCKPASSTASDGGTVPAMVSAGTAEAPREILIEVGDAMKFSQTRLAAAAGETLRLRLVNTSSLPKDAMGHNWVLLRSGVDPTAYANAALKAKATDYVPADRAADVIAHTKMLGGRARDEIVFIVPAEPGDYVFLCTFPAHFQAGMKGVLAVK